MIEINQYIAMDIECLKSMLQFIMYAPILMSLGYVYDWAIGN